MTFSKRAKEQTQKPATATLLVIVSAYNINSLRSCKHALIK